MAPSKAKRPIAVRLRGVGKVKSPGPSRLLTSIDDQIAALENEINDITSDSGDEDSDESSDSDSEGSVHEEEDLVEVRDSDGNIVSIKSKLNDEKINPLPKEYLPDPKCGIPKAVKGPQKPKQPRKTKSNDRTVLGAADGLQKTVDELLRNYTPSSAERRPFWCRICRYQGCSEEDLMNHRQSELHTLASERERKLSTCKLCRKQFTSPEQLKEHLKGKAHIERLSRMNQKQQKSKDFHR